MSKEKAGRRISPRAVAKGAVVAAIFGVGLAVGGGCSGDGVDRDAVDACLPATSAVQLDECLETR
ncbi:hypothetical protein [Gordonia neofelifaecis]|uniref:Uncharacterized protein n=1 Tax=Gordonia neofelifaecis NRRL B-59395 TaxID=644548 RepID=F1YE68_9ACTN|nr:hypothetical protein [Gordonia neofelifaecis]EGD57158.1 hypothetical protein SCNU_02250 [Gordonia neofelifaecis NRRL B-59395]